jgi:hypothetical protein
VVPPRPRHLDGPRQTNHLASAAGSGELPGRHEQPSNSDHTDNSGQAIGGPSLTLG